MSVWGLFTGQHEPKGGEGDGGSTSVASIRTSFFGFMTGQNAGCLSCFDSPRMAKGNATDVRRERTAHHEASHVVAALAAGEILDSVHIFDDGSAFTKTFVDCDDNTGVPKRLRDSLITTAAGEAGEIAYLMERCGYSRRAAEREVDAGCDDDRAQFADLANGTRYTWGEIQNEARRFVRRNSSRINRTAEKLFEQGYL